MKKDLGQTCRGKEGLSPTVQDSFIRTSAVTAILRERKGDSSSWANVSVSWNSSFNSMFLMFLKKIMLNIEN